MVHVSRVALSNRRDGVRQLAAVLRRKLPPPLGPRPEKRQARTEHGCLEFVGPISQPGAEGNRAPAFGPVVAPADDASGVDRLIALTGRDPEWRA